MTAFARAVLISSVSICFSLFASAQTLTFQARQDYDVLDGSNVATGDFHGDGIQDIIYLEPVIEVYLGDGDGTFRVGPSNNGLFGGTSGVAVADLNGDGILDLAVGSVSGTMQVGYGNGDGTFRGGPAINIGVVPTTLTIGDVNGDGLPDILVNTRSLVVFLNQGAGVFGPYTRMLHDQDVLTTAIADVNGDGIPDIVAGVQPGARLLLGTGGGAFVEGQSFSFPGPAGSLMFQDMNGDGKVDLVASSGLYDTIWTKVEVLLGNGKGTFAATTAVPFPNGVHGVLVGDVNGDGKPDLVVLQGGIDAVALALNKGNATFTNPYAYAVTGGAAFFAVAPFREAGLLDIVAIAEGGYSLSVLLNKGHGTYQDGSHIPFPAQPGPLVAADFNGDGLLDLAVLTATGVSLFENTGKIVAPFRAAGTVALTSPTYLITADFNGDGRPDLAAALASGDIAILLGRGNGQFAAPTIVSTGGVLTFNPYVIAAGDFNNDGKVDIVTSLNQILFGKGDGTFAKARPLLGDYFQRNGPLISMVPCDLNHDGNLDLAVLNSYGHGVLRTLINQGNGTFDLGPDSYESGGVESELAVADFNGDGNLDIVITGNEGETSVLLGDGTGGFANPGPPYTYFLPNAYGVVTGDINGDGFADFAISTYGDGNIAPYLGNGDGTFQQPPYIGTAPGASYLLYAPLRGQTGTAKLDFATSAGDGVDIEFNTTP